MRCPATFLSLVGCAALWAAVTANAQSYSEAKSEAANVVAVSGRQRADGVLWEHRFAFPGSKYLRLDIRGLEPSKVPDLKITFLTPSGAELHEATAASFDAAGRYVTPPLYADAVNVQVKARVGEGVHLFDMPTVITERSEAGRLKPQSILPNWLAYPAQLDRATRARVAKVADSVVKLLFGDGEVCSGFLVAPHSILTNFHCVEHSNGFSSNIPVSEIDCRDVVAEFDYNAERPIAPPPSARCVQVLAAEKASDFAVLRVDAVPLSSSGAARPALVLGGPLGAAARSSVLVVHHPVGLPTKVTLHCFAYGHDTSEFRHDCATSPGSSGSPVVDNSGNVVGLHYAGPFLGTETIAEIETAMSEGKVYRNKAKQVDQIWAHIKNKVD